MRHKNGLVKGPQGLELFFGFVAFARKHQKVCFPLNNVRLWLIHVAEHHIDAVAILFKEFQRRAAVLAAPPVVTLLRYPRPRH